MRQAISYVHGTYGRPLLGQTIGAYFDQTVREHPERTALICPEQDIRWTWQELADQIDAVAAGLLAAGLVPGERLAIWAQNRSEWPVTQVAAAKAGLVLVNINPAARTVELPQQLARVGAAGLVVQDRFKASDYLAMLADRLPELANSEPGRLQCEAL